MTDVQDGDAGAVEHGTGVDGESETDDEEKRRRLLLDYDSKPRMGGMAMVDSCQPP